MKKNILIIVLILFSATFILYARIKASDAKILYEEVQMLKQETEQLRDESNELKVRALDEAAKARMAETEALRLKEQLDDC